MDVHFSSKTPEWATPLSFFAGVQEEFKWFATTVDKSILVFGSTPEEAVSQLWLVLNKK